MNLKKELWTNLLLVKNKNKILECFLTHETYSDVDGLNLFSKLKVLKRLELYKEAIIFSKCMYYFQNITNYTYYSCICRKKFFKIKINKIIFKINYVTRKIK